MTLAEIRVEMPELQGRIESLKQRRRQFTNELEEIKANLASLETLINEYNKSIARYEEFLSENESSTVPGIVARVNEYKKRKDDDEKAKKDRENEIADLKKDKENLENDPLYKQMNKEIDEAKEKLEASLKDSSRDGLKTSAENTVKRRKTYLNAMFDDKINPQKARRNLLGSITSLKNDIKSKFGVEIKSQEDMDYILDYVAGKVTGKFKLPSAESKLEKTDRIVAKLEEKRDAKLAELSSKAIAPISPQNTHKIEENTQLIEDLRRENDESLTPAIAEATQKISELDAKINEKTQVTPEDIAALEEAERKLKQNHVISEEVVTDLKDENSDLSQLFKKFVEADLELRKAFRENEYDKTDEAKNALVDAIGKYKVIAEQLASESGYSIEAWQYYNKSLLNKKILSGETIDDIYTYPEKRNFYKLSGDKRVKKNKVAIGQYNDICEDLSDIDELENKILDGDFSVPAALISSLEKYHTSVGALHSNMSSVLDVYGIIKGNQMTKPSMLTRIKNFFGKFKDQVLFELPRNGKNLIDDYLSKKPGANLSEEEKEELENLRREKEDLTNGRSAFEDKKIDNENIIAQLETENTELAARDAARTTSELGTQDELSFVTREGIEAKGYIEGKSVKEEITKVIDDEGR